MQTSRLAKMTSRNVKNIYKPMITRVRPLQPKTDDPVSTNSTELTTFEPLSSLSTATLITDLADPFTVPTKATYVNPYIPRLCSSIQGMSRTTSAKQTSSPVLKLDVDKKLAST
ncbi:unnamed protein product, partial [Didymodactylos carnosus]